MFLKANVPKSWILLFIYKETVDKEVRPQLRNALLCILYVL